MPIYEYKCKKCGEKFEQRLGFFHRDSSVKCPKCGTDNPERIYSPFMSSSGSCSPGPSRFR